MIERAHKLEQMLIPDNIDYHNIPSLSREGREKLDKIRPISIGQAGRIAGVTPSDISILTVYIRSRNGGS